MQNQHRDAVLILHYMILVNYLNSSQLLTGIEATSILQNERMNALARRALVMSGILWSIAARRIL